MILTQARSARRITAFLMVGASALVLASCTQGERRVGLTGGGAVLGALIGGQTGGSRGALAGALIGGAAGLLVSIALDEIEAQQVAQAQLAAARTGRPVATSFTNKSGKRVSQRTRVVRTYDCGGSRCRELSTAVTRDGNTETTTGTAREVKTAGKTEWVAG
jgi:surface antigen